ncbi:MAG: potassium transporter TrkA [Deltaproteobacteria bacterium]|nr:potassium transporter TrkA [Deltaproteobacteria bacterium]
MPSIRQRLRYRFDNLMARGTGAQILLLAVITVVLVLITAGAIEICDVVPEDDTGADSFGRLAWKSLNHALDAGAVGGDAGSWTFLIIMMLVTIGGLFVLSALIGILNNGFSALIESLRRGRSTVIERNHTVILGWSPKIHTLLSEFAAAGENQRNACVVVLANRDKVAMDADVAESLGSKRLRVVTRAGSPMNLGDLELASLETSKAVVVLAPETHPDGREMAPHESDTVVLKTLLAINKAAGKLPLHVVAEIFDERTETVARMVVGANAALIVAPPLISRLLVQTGRQSGLSVVYTELLDFGGVEMYVKPEPGLTGQTFRDAVFAYDDSALLGVVTAEGQTLVPPPLDRRFAPGDQVVVISEDDDTALLNGKPVPVADGAIVAAPRQALRHRERTLVLGGSARLRRVLGELDAYVAPGSETIVVGDGEVLTAAGDLGAGIKNMTVQPYAGDVTERGMLDRLNVAGFDHILLLSETAGRSQEMADARTMITLLHLRDIARIAGKAVPITSEILQIENRDLAAVAQADDFIVSNTLVSLLVSQVAENRHLVKVFEELFTAGGHEIYLKPAAEYVALGVDVPYQAVVEAALRRNEVAIGFRLAATARDAAASYGVTVSPSKSRPLRFAPGDKIIVVADE